MFNVIPYADTAYLNDELLDNGKLKIKPASFYESIPHNHLILWCNANGVYSLPTIELMDWLKQHIVEGKTIEIGAGLGFGRYLGIPMTDSCYMRNKPEVIKYYKMFSQPLTKYPDDIIEMDALKAVDHYKPDVVVGSWITHLYKETEPWREGNMFGVDESVILKTVKKYIMIGNKKVHSKKPILDLPHKEYTFSWLYSRSQHASDNIIYVWEN